MSANPAPSVASNGVAAPSQPRESGARQAYQAGIRYFLGPLVQFLDDETVSEVMVNGHDQIYIERGGKVVRTEARFQSEAELRAAANNIAQFVGKTITEKEPILDGRLPDGSRVCIILEPISGAGTSVNIRRFSRSAVTPEFLLKRNAITAEALEFVLIAVEAALNIVVSGGTGSGKTTLLNIISTAFSDSDRVVVIEDTRELQIQKQHVVQLEARPADAYGKGAITVRDLFVASLRMRPDRIVVGEVRRGEALDMVQAMTSGHRGSLATLHADNPSQACGRLETMCLMADLGLPMIALRRQIALAVDLFIQTSRLHSGRRLVTHLSEVEFDEPSGTYKVRDIFNLDTSAEEPTLRWTGERPTMAKDLKWLGLLDKVNLTKQVFGL
ncbi:MAG: ATPase, T2SS/T4P/T4SS family [Planctomycetota bacterium]|nr:ATPase, T2SS/T4P/T4SS family [Planctomycetota bacterium]